MGRTSNGKQHLMDAVLELIWTGSYGTTTIDQICEKSGVKKGSFYYFFDSKADLAAAAIDASWQIQRVKLDALFSPTVSPLDRLKNYCEFTYRFQREIKEKYGRVLGCPQFALGAEICTQDGKLQTKIQEIINYKLKYLESAVRDAHAAGLIQAPDPAGKAQIIMAYHHGLLTQARIQNDAEVLRDAAREVFMLLGVNKSEPVST